MKKKLFSLQTISRIFIFSLTGTFLFAEPTIESKSRINWVTKDFTSELSLDVEKTNLQMPSGKKSASMQIKSKMPQLIQTPLLSLFNDSNTALADMLIQNQLTFDQIQDFILSGYKTPDVFTKDMKNLNTTNKNNINDIEKLLVHHTVASKITVPINTVFSRAYTGIIIDARGSYPVHGEYIESEVYPSLFPQVWDENMNPIFERNMVDPEVVKESGLCGFHYSEDNYLYQDRIGADPLYIRATQVYGRNRTDPVIKSKDALKILSIPENRQLIKEGKVVILLNKDNLIYDISTAEKDNSYYVQYNSIKQYFYENKVPDVIISDSINGILFSVDLKFYPDSPELLPSENHRIAIIAESLQKLLMDDGYTILIEGHTADVGKPVGQLNLSIERTRTVMNALIDEGLDKKLFTYKGYGATMPIAPNDTEAGRAQNRRVDITARPRATYIQRDW